MPIYLDFPNGDDFGRLFLFAMQQPNDAIVCIALYQRYGATVALASQLFMTSSCQNRTRARVGKICVMLYLLVSRASLVDQVQNTIVYFPRNVLANPIKSCSCRTGKRNIGLTFYYACFRRRQQSLDGL